MLFRSVHGLDKIFASPLVRAQQTAKPTCELLGLDCQIEEWISENADWQDLSVTKDVYKRQILVLVNQKLDGGSEAFRRTGDIGVFVNGKNNPFLLSLIHILILLWTFPQE